MGMERKVGTVLHEVTLGGWKRYRSRQNYLRGSFPKKVRRGLKGKTRDDLHAVTDVLLIRIFHGATATALWLARQPQRGRCVSNHQNGGWFHSPGEPSRKYIVIRDDDAGVTNKKPARLRGPV